MIEGCEPSSGTRLCCLVWQSCQLRSYAELCRAPAVPVRWKSCGPLECSNSPGHPTRPVSSSSPTQGEEATSHAHSPLTAAPSLRGRPITPRPLGMHRFWAYLRCRTPQEPGHSEVCGGTGLSQLMLVTSQIPHSFCAMQAMHNISLQGGKKGKEHERTSSKTMEGSERPGSPRDSSHLNKIPPKRLNLEQPSHRPAQLARPAF